MRVLVTGGAGFIGSHTVDALLERDHDVTVIDNLSTGKREFVAKEADFHECDIRSDECENVVRAARPEVIIHLAAQKAVPDSVRDPLFDAEVNILGTIRLLRAANTCGTRRFVFASSGGTVYGESDAIPTPEETNCLPVSPYGTSKLSAEYYVKCFQKLGGPGYTILRYANVYGPRQDPTGEAGVVAIFVQKMLRGDKPTIHGDGEQTRDYVYVRDVVNANMLALEEQGNEVYNVGTGLETSVNAIFQMVKTDTASSIEEHHGPAKPGEQRRGALDISHAKDTLGWTPTVSLKQGIEETIDWFRKA